MVAGTKISTQELAVFIQNGFADEMAIIQALDKEYTEQIDNLSADSLEALTTLENIKLGIKNKLEQNETFLKVGGYLDTLKVVKDELTKYTNVAKDLHVRRKAQFLTYTKKLVAEKVELEKSKYPEYVTTLKNSEKYDEEALVKVCEESFSLFCLISLNIPDSALANVTTRIQTELDLQQQLQIALDTKYVDVHNVIVTERNRVKQVETDKLEKEKLAKEQLEKDRLAKIELDEANKKIAAANVIIAEEKRLAKIELDAANAIITENNKKRDEERLLENNRIIIANNKVVEEKRLAKIEQDKLIAEKQEADAKIAKLEAEVALAKAPVIVAEPQVVIEEKPQQEEVTPTHQGTEKSELYEWCEEAYNELININIFNTEIEIHNDIITNIKNYLDK